MDIQYLAVIVAGLAAVISGLVGAGALSLARQQSRIDATAVTAEWIRDLRSWASEAIDVLSEASYTVRRGDAELDADAAATLKKCRHCLSALVDRGRLLLPNEREAERGAENPEAYRGFRHPALDALVAAERILGGDADLSAFTDDKTALIGVRREFVSIVQGILDPHSSNTTIAAMLAEAHTARRDDPTMGGLLPDTGSMPVGPVGILQAASTRHGRGLRAE